MTTAHKPTWNAAIGSSEQGGSLRGVVSRQVSAKDQTAHTKLHFRQTGQNAPSELKKRDFRRELEERERRYREEKGIEEAPVALPAPLQLAIEDRESQPAFNLLDKDDSFSSSSSDSDSESSESDEQAELMRELERIQKERNEERKRIAAERARATQETLNNNALRGNPLLNPDQQEAEDFTIRKKWYEDTVFRNQTRGAPAKKKPRFVNDTIRNDFHRKFLDKYIK